MKQLFSILLLLAFLPVVALGQVPESEVPNLCLELDGLDPAPQPPVNSQNWTVPAEDTILLVTAEADSAMLYTGGPGNNIWVCKTQGAVYVQTGYFGIYNAADPVTIGALSKVETEDRTSPFHVAVYDHPLRYANALPKPARDWAGLPDDIRYPADGK